MNNVCVNALGYFQQYVITFETKPEKGWKEKYISRKNEKQQG